MDRSTKSRGLLAGLSVRRCQACLRSQKRKSRRRRRRRQGSSTLVTLSIKTALFGRHVRRWLPAHISIRYFPRFLSDTKVLVSDQQSIESWLQVSMFVICLNCITLALYDPMDPDCETTKCQVVNGFDLAFTIFFFVEMCIKIVAMVRLAAGS